MILTVSNNPSRRWMQNDAKLLDECDDYFLYDECGWFYLVLYKNTNRILHVHFNSREDRINTLRGCGYNWDGINLYKMRSEERQTWSRKGYSRHA